MSRMYLLVEGQTEEAFVNELLVAHYARLGLFLIPIIVSTSPGYKGGW
jgi:predicted ATP-dependent endonuclease of OLD family